MSTVLSPNILQNHHQELVRHLPRNYVAHSLEGGVFIGGMAFIDQGVILPEMIRSLGAPSWLIAFLPSILMTSVIVPQILFTGWTESLRKMKPFVLTMGILYRIPILAVGLMLLYCQNVSGVLAIAALVAAPVIASILGGCAVGAWQELVARTIPGTRLSSLWAVRLVLGACLGLGAGKIVSYILNETPGTVGYGRLHLITFGFLMVSYGIFSIVREIPLPPKTVPGKSNWRLVVRSLSQGVQSDKQFKRFLYTRILSTAPLVCTPFLSIHALNILDSGQNALGAFLTCQMLGVIVSNVIGGYVGDRYGSKIVLVTSYFVYIITLIMIAFAGNEEAFRLVFLLLGIANGFNMVGSPTMGLEMSPVQHRVKYASLISIYTLVGVLGASMISAMMRIISTDLITLIIPALIMMVGSLLILVRIPEPRRKPA